MDGGVAIFGRMEESWEGTALLDPKANMAQLYCHGANYPLIYPPMPFAPPIEEYLDDCPPEIPTPPSYPQPLLSQFSRDPKATLARETAEFFGYVLNYKRELKVEILEGRNLAGNNPHCAVHFGNSKNVTPVIPRNSHPVFNSKHVFIIRDQNEDEEVEIKVKNKQTLTSTTFGSCILEPSKLHEEIQYDQWIQLTKEDCKKDPGDIRLAFSISSPTLDSILFNISQKSSSYCISEQFGNSIFSVEGQDTDFYLIDRFGNRIFDLIRRDTNRKIFSAEPIFDILQAGTDRVLTTISRKVNLLTVDFFLEIMGELVTVQRGKWNSLLLLREQDKSFIAQLKRNSLVSKGFSVEVAPLENVPLLLAISIVLSHEDTQVSD